MLPLALPALYAAAAGLGSFLLINQMSKSKVLAKVEAAKAQAATPATSQADAVNKLTSVLDAQNAVLNSGITLTDEQKAALDAAAAAAGAAAGAVGHANRTLNREDIVLGPNGIRFRGVAPPEFLNQTDFSFFQQVSAGDILTVDVGAAGIQLSEIPNGNMLFRATGPADMNALTIPGTSIDLRLPQSTNVVTLPLRAVTDVGAQFADFSKIILSN